ncbi:MAG: undecaprenyl-diphosphate phosphatase [candidate division KSB1 bacterium]|nr:undecaprenyl-diphosphate phosphatase [candidate division KSB1 bacterium]
MNLLKAAVLGIVQGLTEFLPVSSSGHLVLAEHFLHFEGIGLEFEVFLHFGTLLAILTVFYQDILRLFAAFFALFGRQTRQNGLAVFYRQNQDVRTLLYLIIASIPAGVIGVLYEDQIEQVFSDPHLTSIMLLVTAGLLAATFFVKLGQNRLVLLNTFIIGLAQAAAILPGISRSGATISAGLLQKLDSDQAARFSFLLAVPAILGATLLKTVDVIQAGLDGDALLVLTVGMVCAYISGLAAIRSLLTIVRRGKLYYFAPYCLLLGLLGLLLI